MGRGSFTYLIKGVVQLHLVANPNRRRMGKRGPKEKTMWGKKRKTAWKKQEVAQRLEN
jgi:hypothetical protein